MRPRQSLVLPVLCAIPAARAVWHAVGVGVQGFVFTPATVAAEVNDALHLVIPDANITVVQSAGLDAPCTPLPGGFRSVAGLGKLDLSIFDDSPIYAFAAPHCAEGMVFIANPRAPSDLDTMQRNARASAASPPRESESDAGAAGSTTKGEYVATRSTPVETSTPPPPSATDSHETRTTPTATNSASTPHDDAQSSAPGPNSDDTHASNGQTAEQNEQAAVVHQGASPGLLAGVVVGCVAGTTLVVLLGVFLCKRRRRRRSDKASLSPTGELSARPLTLGPADSWSGGWRRGRKGDAYVDAGPPPAYIPSEP